MISGRNKLLEPLYPTGAHDNNLDLRKSQSGATNGMATKIQMGLSTTQLPLIVIIISLSGSLPPRQQPTVLFDFDNLLLELLSITFAPLKNIASAIS